MNEIRDLINQQNELNAKKKVVFDHIYNRLEEEGYVYPCSYPMGLALSGNATLKHICIKDNYIQARIDNSFASIYNDLQVRYSDCDNGELIEELTKHIDAYGFNFSRWLANFLDLHFIKEFWSNEDSVNGAYYKNKRYEIIPMFNGDNGRNKWLFLVKDNKDDRNLYKGMYQPNFYSSEEPDTFALVDHNYIERVSEVELNGETYRIHAYLGYNGIPEKGKVRLDVWCEKEQIEGGDRYFITCETTDEILDASKYSRRYKALRDKVGIVETFDEFKKLLRIIYGIA